MSVYWRGVAATLKASTRQTPRGRIAYFEEIEDPEGTEVRCYNINRGYASSIMI